MTFYRNKQNGKRSKSNTIQNLCATPITNKLI